MFVQAGLQGQSKRNQGTVKGHHVALCKGQTNLPKRVGLVVAFLRFLELPKQVQRLHLPQMQVVHAAAALTGNLVHKDPFVHGFAAQDCGVLGLPHKVALRLTKDP